MKVVVFGANGACGVEIVKACKEKGHSVVAAVRRPGTITAEDVEVRQIDLDDENSVLAAVSGTEAVISALGSSPAAAFWPTKMYSTSIRAIRRSMRKCSIRRLIVISASGIYEEPNFPWIYRHVIRRYLMNAGLDMLKMETILEETEDLDWTVVRPPEITPGPSKPYKVYENAQQDNAFTIHPVDVGAFIANELTACEWIHKFAAPGYPR